MINFEIFQMRIFYLVYRVFEFIIQKIFMSKPVIPVQTTFTELDCEKAFQALQNNEALYAYHFAKACWSGSKICYFERSYESPAILYLLLKGFEKGAQQTVDSLKDKISEESVKQVLIYLAAVIDNNGNYKSFGDSKFIPECSSETFKQFFLNTPYWSAHPQQFEKIYERIEPSIFNAETPFALIDFSDKKGTSGYYSKNITSADAQKMKNILVERGIKSENNRMTKQGDNEFTIKIASVEKKEQIIEEKGWKIKLQYGEFSPFLRDLNIHLSQAKKYAANQYQANMIELYLEHFKGGDVNKHIDSQKEWIKDKGPIIETNIGFIESYLDPLKLRAEFEGFVAVVNKEESELLNKLVAGAEQTLALLPWGKHFECDVFKKPDFTSLDVLAFASSGIPVGINIPNYDEVRQHLGFKNVNLGNAYGKPTKQSLQYVPESEKQMNLEYYNPSLFIIVALHELLGHGSGKLYDKLPEIASPLDNQPFTTFYKPNEIWHSVFGEIASTYEECKADSVALYLSLFENVQEQLLPKYTKEQRWDIVYVAWYDLVMGGIKGLEYYDAKHDKWLQAHIGASYAILSVLREAGDIVEIKQVEKDGKQSLDVVLNRANILTKGKQAIGRFLQHLQIYKSTADVQRGTKFFEHYLKVDEEFLKYRELVIKNKRPRRLTVQPDVKLNGDKIEYIKFENTAYGQIDSALSHYGENLEDIIEQWESNNQEFRYC